MVLSRSLRLEGALESQTQEEDASDESLAGGCGSSQRLNICTFIIVPHTRQPRKHWTYSPLTPRLQKNTRDDPRRPGPETHVMTPIIIGVNDFIRDTAGLARALEPA